MKKSKNVKYPEINIPCEICHINTASEPHHKLSQSDEMRKRYPEYIDDEKNIIWICNDCHLNKPIPKYSEREFREVMNLPVKGELEK